MRQLKHIAVIAGVVTALAVLASACTSDKKSSAATSAATTFAGPDVAGNGAAFAGPSESAPAAATAGAPSAAAAGRTAPPSSLAAGGTSQVLTGRKVVYTADITVRAQDIKSAVDQVHQIATGRGGVIFGEAVQLALKDPQTSGAASATITLKVPPDTLDQGILDQIGRIGTELDRNEHADDVTAQVADVGSRVKAANASLDRLEALFQHAGNVNDLANVENQIAQREADLESLEAQQTALDKQTAEATITVNLVAAPPVSAALAHPTKKAHVFGFLRGLRGGWHAFTAAATGIATATGALLPFIGVLLILAAVGLLIRRRVTRAALPPHTAEPAS
jgi:hypothetical protein